MLAYGTALGVLKLTVLLDNTLRKIPALLQDLNEGHVNSALQVLQQDLADLKIQRPQLHKLAGCLLCTSQQALVDHIAWAGTKGFKNREKLLRDLQVRPCMHS